MTSSTTNQSKSKVARIFGNRNRIIVMGVLNVTPDSFSDGGRFYDFKPAVDHCRRMVAEGADIIDVGGESSRPGAQPVTVEEELRRVIPVIETIARDCPALISIDTCKAAVAEAALNAGASIVNDISGLHDDPQLAAVVSRHDAGLVIMHRRGTPAMMQNDTVYQDLIGEIERYLVTAIAAALAAGIAADKIMIDPGIGFGKDMQGNLDIIKSLDRFRRLGKPVLVGVSRKSFIGKITGADIVDRLPGSLAAAAVVTIYGAAAVRVHDVAATRQVVDLAVKLRRD